MPSRDEFAAARKAAIDCANASGWLLQVAAGKARLTPSQEKGIAKLLDQELWGDRPVEMPDPSPIHLPIALDGLCKALASGWGVISKVEDDLTREAPGPATAGGMTRPNAHRLAWDFGRHLWASIRNLDLRFDPQWQCLNTIDASRFDLDGAMVRENLPAIVAELNSKPPFDSARVVALIKQESVHAIDRLESAPVEPARLERRTVTVRKPFVPVPAELQELIDSIPPGSVRSLRQVIEQDGLTEEVLKIGPATLRDLIGIFEDSASFRADIERLAAVHPAVITAVIPGLKRIDELRERHLSRLQPCVDQLQGIASRLFSGAKLDGAIVRRLCSEIVHKHPNLTATDVNELPLPVAVELLLWTAAPSMPEAPVGQAAPPWEEAQAGRALDAPPTLVPYENLDRQIDWFDPAPPTQFWPGRERWDDIHLHKGFWHLHRANDGIWICHFSFDGHFPSMRDFEPKQKCFHWQITPKQTETWFVENGQSPPPVLFEDLARQAPPHRSSSEASTEERVASPPVLGTEAPPPVRLDGPDDPVFVWGKKKAPLAPAQYRVIAALVEAGKRSERLSKDALCLATKDRKGNVVEDPVGALERLCRRDDDWRDVIDMAGIPGRGYGLKNKPPTPTQRS